MLQPRSITSMFNYPRVPQCRVLLNYLQQYFFCFSCAAWTMMWQPLEQMVATTRGKLRFSIREEMVNSEAVPLTPTDLQFCRQFHKASPQTGGKYVENLLDFVKACFASPGHGWCWNLEAPMRVSILPCDSPVSCPVLGPQKCIYCLFNHPNELQPLFGSLPLSLCFPKLEHSTEAVKVGCCPERAMALSESPCMAGLFSNHASEALEVSRPQKND